ncbi:hypothetical protein GGR21_002206 [Dysgonomonas hofstadii]|uniref:SusD family protein n=1 Tax=Dysgonomonas hofstadii TaxID=637886 RepID=A0A840CRR3_9BACT|nr:RagB/SusD family nutrient uptake outer membrane protein [Dysgonomonas hofstadii]MBB4036304.1 hypothetical protein [Dysgonomonas hofstadii]
MKKIIIFLTLLLAITGCESQLDKMLPRNAIPLDEMTADDIEKLMTGVYAEIERQQFNGWFDFDYKAENYKEGPGWVLTDPVMMTPGDGDIKNRWQTSFVVLNQVNALIESYEALSGAPTAKEKQIGGTGYFFRALIYYDMAIRWGNVPILDKQNENLVPISQEENVWAFTEGNIEKALSILQGFTNSYYVSLEAAQALAARIYLARGNKTKVLENVNAVLLNNNFILANTSEEFASIYVTDAKSKETIFGLANKRSTGQLVFSQKLNDVDPTWDYSPATDVFQSLFADDNILNRKGDRRAKATFSSDDKRVIKFPNGISGQQLVPTPDQANTPIVISRIAEMYLIKAELLGPVDGADILLAFLQKRYDNVPTNAAIQALSESDFQDLILDERHREFYGEGYWWFDIKRTGRLDLLKTLNGRNYLMYYPIPQNEIDLAGTTAYPQNPGYAGAK